MTVYTIRVIGHVDAHKSDWFDGLTINNMQLGEAMISAQTVAGTSSSSVTEPNNSVHT